MEAGRWGENHFQKSSPAVLQGHNDPTRLDVFEDKSMGFDWEMVACTCC